MTASTVLPRARPALLAVLALALGIPPAATAVTIDSFTDPLPPHASLTASGAQVLFLGSQCDGAACPPGTVVTNPNAWDITTQTGLPGVFGGQRRLSFATFFEPNPGSSGLLRIDPSSGGRMAVTTPVGPPLSVWLSYGDSDQPLHVDLRADGSDRFEIEILAASTGEFGSLRVTVMLAQDDLSIGGKHAGAAFWITGPGVLVVPYSALPGLDTFDDDVDTMKFHFDVFRGTGAAELTIGGVRTAAGPTPAEPATWGRIKGSYRR